MKKTLMLVVGLIGVVMLIASCGMLSTEVVYSPDNPKAGEEVQFGTILAFDIDDMDEDEEFICENKRHKKDYGKVYTRDSKHFKKHVKHIKHYKKYTKKHKRGGKHLDKLENKVDKKIDRSKKTYEWDFNSDSITDSTEEYPIYVFTEAGTYWVSVAVVVKNPDKKSRKDYGDFTVFGATEVIVEVIVDPPTMNTPPVIGFITIVNQANFNVFTYGTRVGRAMYFSSFTFDAEGDDLTYLWDFGDGSTSTEAEPSYSYSVYPEPPAYPIAGQHTVTLTIDDGNGGTDSESGVIAVGH